MKNVRGSAVLLSALMAMFTLSIASAQETLTYQQVVDQKTAALVTVKYLLQMGVTGEEAQEMETEITGVMMSADGLVLCSNTQLGGPMGMMQRMMGGMMRSMGQDMRLTPKDIKVHAGGEAEGMSAKLLARDTDLDLAWIKIDDPKDKKFEFVDFSKGVTPALGDGIVWVRRLSKHFDRVPVVDSGRIGGIVKKPREFFVPSGMSASSGTGLFGIPVFSAKGEIIGVTTLHASDEEVDMDNPMGMMSQMFGMADGMGGMILPAAEIIRATERAKQSEEKEE